MIDSNSYLSPELSNKDLDRFYARTSILSALRSALPSLSGRFLDIGCGQMPYRDLILKSTRVDEYIGLDLGNNKYAEHQMPDAIWDGLTIPYEDCSFESAMATEVLEHCPDPQNVINEVYRILKKDGVFFFTVPFLWPLHDMPYDEYRYTPFALRRMFENAEFYKIDIVPLGGWDASLAQMLGLWVNRRPFGKSKRKFLQRLLKPIIKYLIRKDQIPDLMKGPMITGLYGTAIK